MRSPTSSFGGQFCYCVSSLLCCLYISLICVSNYITTRISQVPWRWRVSFIVINMIQNDIVNFSLSRFHFPCLICLMALLSNVVPQVQWLVGGNSQDMEDWRYQRNVQREHSQDYMVYSCLCSYIHGCRVP